MILKIHSKKYGDFKVLYDVKDKKKILKHKWYMHKGNSTFYVKTNIDSNNGKHTTMRLHRYLMNTPANKIVDHKNGIGFDCRRKNMRNCTIAQNSMNRRKLKNTSSLFKGVSWYKKTKRWEASIKINKKTIKLGYFDTPRLAHQAYCKASKKYHGEFGRVI